MTLALGTALQNGTYVIDALNGEDSIGPLYLATHVPSGQWGLVRVLGSRHPETLPDSAQRAAFYQYLDTLSQLDQAFIPKNLRGFEEEKVCYQTFSLPQGSPLSHSITPQAPLPLAPSLTLIRRLAQDLQALRPLGWAGLRLTPDQVWQAGPSGAITLTGFDFPAVNQSSTVDLDEANLVRGLTGLLYFLLTGQWADHTQTPLGADLRHRRPELPATVDAVFQWGTPSLALAQPPSLDQWLTRLPNLAHPGVHPSQPVEPAHRSAQGAQPSMPTPGPAQPQRTVIVNGLAASATPTTQVIAPRFQPQPPKRGPKSAWVLVATGLVFGLGGVTFGLQARIQPASPAAQTRFNPNQSFPPLPDWNTRDPDFDHPTIENRRSRPGPRPSAAPAPAETPPRPARGEAAPPAPAPALRPQAAPRPQAPAINREPSAVPHDDALPIPSDPEIAPAPPPAPQKVAPAPVPLPLPAADPAPTAPAPEAPALTAPAPIAPAPVPVVPAPVAPPPPVAPPVAPPTPLTSS